MIHTVKGFSPTDETEVDVFLEFPCFLSDPVDVSNLIFGSSTFSIPSLDVWKFLVCIILKPSMQDFKYDLTSRGDECNYPMVGTFFCATLLGNWDKDWPFPVLIWIFNNINSSNTWAWSIFLFPSILFNSFHQCLIFLSTHLSLSWPLNLF